MSDNEPTDRQSMKNQLTSEIRQFKQERKAISTELGNNGPLTVPQLADATGLAADKVLQHILVMMKSGQVVEAGQRDGGYVYDIKR
jgi:Fic family protein